MRTHLHLSSRGRVSAGLTWPPDPGLLWLVLAALVVWSC